MGITDSDFEKIPDILNDYDYVMLDNKNKRGFESVVFIKTFGDKESHVVMGLITSKTESKLIFNTIS